MFLKWPIFIAIAICFGTMLQKYSQTIWSIYKPLASYALGPVTAWTWQAISCACGLIYSGDARVRTEDVILLLAP